MDWQDYCSRHPECKTEYQVIKHCKNRYPIKISHVENLTFRPLLLQARTAAKVKLPSSVDLRSKLPPCYDQGNLGSCTANALVAAYQYLTPNFMGSRLFLYYNERVIEGSVKQDAGAYIHDGVWSLQKTGICSEKKWPYNVSKFAIKPSAECYAQALAHKAVKVYNVVQTLEAMKGYLISGFPFTVGIVCYDSFDSTAVMKTGLVTYPKKNEKILGGHAILCVGFDDAITCPGSPPGAWLMRNSWSTNIYGSLKGNFYIPYGYLTNLKLTSDCWEITQGSS